MKTYFFTVKHEHWRNGTTVAITAGIVKAANKIEAEDEAEDIIFQNVSSTNTFDLTLIKLEEDENCFTDYIPASVFR